MKISILDWKRRIKNLLLVLAGTLVLSFGTAVFIFPFDLISGGVSGYSIVIHHLLPFSWLTVDMVMTALTWILFFLGFLIMGKGFAAKTLISTLFYPVGVSLFMWLSERGMFNLLTSAHADIAIILASLFGGLCVGSGCAITFLGGGSTGGVDILGLILCKIFRRLKSSVAFFIVDAAAVILGMFVIGDFVVSLLGIISAFLAAIMVDKVFLGGNSALIAQIITDNYDEINRAVIEKMNRTTTIVDAVGGYSGSPKKMVMVSLTMRQYSELLSIINRLDKNAFVTVHRAHEINGEGWTR